MENIFVCYLATVIWKYDLYSVFWSSLHSRGHRYFCIDSNTGYLHKAMILVFL